MKFIFANILVLFFNFLCLFLLLNLNEANAKTEKVFLYYDVSWGNFQIAAIESELEKVDDRILITGGINTIGILENWISWESFSSAEIKQNKNKWTPVFLSISRITKSSQITSSVHWSSTGSILSDIQNPPLDHSKVFPININMKNNVIDPYSAVMQQLDQILYTKSCNGEYQIYDGLRRYDVKFKTFGREILVADRPFSFDGETLRCEMVLNPLGGHKINSNWHKRSENERIVSIFFGQFAENLFIPVRFEFKTNLGRGVVRLDMKRSVTLK